jgi:predicted Zn finger-like uncharacterized protein
MDVRCEHCRTEYRFDDAKIAGAGVTVRCSVCSHVFFVGRHSPAQSHPPALPASPPKMSAPPREWKVRRAGGKVLVFRDLTVLQRWIVERKLLRSDEISATGESWKRLGEIAELASFFRVVEAAERAAAFEGATLPPAQPRATPAAPIAATATSAPVAFAEPFALETAAPAATPLPPFGSTGPAPEPRSAAQAPVLVSEAIAQFVLSSGAPSRELEMGSGPSDGEARSTAWERAPAGPPAKEGHDPAWSAGPQSLSSDLEDAEVKAIRGSHRPLTLWLAALAVAAVAAAAGLDLRSARAGRADPAADPAVATAPGAAPEAPSQELPRATSAAPSAPAPGAKSIEVAGSAPPAAPRPVPSPAHAGPLPSPAPGAPSEAAAASDAKPSAPAKAPAAAQTAAATQAAAPGPEAPPPGAASFDWYLQQGLALRDRHQAKAALQMYERAEALDSQSAEPPTGKGYCLIELGQYGSAVDQFKEALRRNGRFHDALLGLAEAYRFNGDKARAIESYERYLEEAPDGPEAPLARRSIESLSQD